MMKFSLLVFLFTSCSPIFSQMQQKQVGKVFYFTIPSNPAVTIRNDSIANSINDYINKNAPKSFPTVLLQISDQDKNNNNNNNLSNFEYLLVYYQKYKGEFFDPYSAFVDVNGEHVGIDVALYKNHYEQALIAIKYSVIHLKSLKKIEKKLSRKKINGDLTDDDLNKFYLYKKGF